MKYPITPIIVAVEVDPVTLEVPHRAPGISFYVQPESWENVPQTVARLVQEFNTGCQNWHENRKSYADGVRERGNILSFVPVVIPH